MTDRFSQSQPWLSLKLKCNAKATLCYLIVCDRCGTMSKNRLTFLNIYVQSWQNHLFPKSFRKHTQGPAPSCDVTHDTENKYSTSSILLFSASLHEKCLFMRAKRLWDGIWHSDAWIRTFWLCLAVRSVRCDVTSENSRQIYESTPFCLVNNKVLDLGKYCEFDQKLRHRLCFFDTFICKMS